MNNKDWKMTPSRSVALIFASLLHAALLSASVMCAFNKDFLLAIYLILVSHHTSWLEKWQRSLWRDADNRMEDSIPQTPWDVDKE